MSNQKQVNEWDWDQRVRERHLKNGVITDKDLEKQLSQLPDLAEQCEGFSIPQPALGGREET